MMTIAGSSPFGSQPPFSPIRLRPTVCPSIGVPNSTTYVPTSRKATSASTLISAHQNSSSPKTLTDTRFSDSTTASATSAHTHCGTELMNGEYLPKNFMYRATAVTSTMAVIAQLSQYIQPAAKAAFSP